MEQNITSEDVKRRIKSRGLTIEEAAGILGMTRQNLTKILSQPLKPKFIRLVKDRLPPVGAIETIEGRNEAIPINLGSFQIMLVPEAPVIAQAGYLRGYADKDYIESLPKIPWLVDREYKGNYMCFEVGGDSMDDGSSESYLQGDIVLCREIPTDAWRKSKLHLKRWSNYVVVHKTEGILIKNIVEHEVAAGLITIHSLNTVQYPDSKLKIDDIAQIFNVVQFKRTVKS